MLGIYSFLAAVMKICIWLTIALGTNALSLGQTTWQRSEKTDALRGTVYAQFTLKGMFLTPPKDHTSALPELVVHCLPGKHLRIYNGRFLDGYVVVGTVLDSVVLSQGPTIPVHYRLDDGKIQDWYWSPSTDHTSAFFSGPELDNLLYGQLLPHKDGKGAPVHKVVLALNEHLASEVVMQFDMPDPTSLADTCGALVHRK